MIQMLQDVHTYLVISFVLMLVLLYKKAYKSIDKSVSNGINTIKQEIDNLKNTKKEIENQTKELNTQIKFKNDHIEQAQENAKIDADNFTQNKLIENKNILIQVRKQQEDNCNKLSKNIEQDIQQKLIQLIPNAILKQIHCADNINEQSISADNTSTDSTNTKHNTVRANSFQNTAFEYMLSLANKSIKN